MRTARQSYPAGFGTSSTALADAGSLDTVRYGKWAIWVACALTLIVAVRLQELVPPLAKIRPAVLASSIGLSYLIAKAPRDGWQRVWREPMVRLFLVFYGWALLGVPFAHWVGGAFEAASTPVFTMLALLVAPLLAAPRRSDLDWLQRTWVHGMSAHMMVLFAVGSVFRGRLFVEGAGLDQNDYAAMAALAFCLSVGLVQREKSALWRGLAFFSACVLALAVVRTGSRGGALAIMMGAMIFVLAARGFRKVLWIALFVIGGLVAWNAASWNFQRAMIDLVQGKQDYNTTDYVGRKQVWARAMHVYIPRYPIRGVGMANFPVVEGEYNTETGRTGKWSAAHNSYLQAAVELGIPGGLLFITIVLTAGARGWRLRSAFRDPTSGRTENRPEYVAAVAAFATSGYFLSHAYFYAFYGLLGLIAFAWRVSQAEAEHRAALQHTGIANRAPVATAAPALVAQRERLRGVRGWRSRASWERYLRSGAS